MIVELRIAAVQGELFKEKGEGGMRLTLQLVIVHLTGFTVGEFWYILYLNLCL